MVFSVAFQMDHIGSVDIDADSTFVLALEAQNRGHTLYHYLPDALTLNGEQVIAAAQRLKLRREAGNHYMLGALEAVDLASVDVVHMRQDPPFDMSYITATYLLERVHPNTLVVNDPAHVRNAPEKLFMIRYPELLPPTLISRYPDEINAFRAEHKDIVVKPLFSNGGFGVFHIGPEDENLNALIEMHSAINREPLMVQKYLPEVREGDRRIILIDGVAAGAINRIPQPGEARSNMHVGGRPVKWEMTARDWEICEAIGPDLRERGLILVGIDVIGDYLTEINVTSPTGLQEIGRFDGVNLEAQIWDAIESRF